METATGTAAATSVLRVCDFSHDDWLLFVRAERAKLGNDPLWQRAERALCFAPTTTDPSRGFVYWASRYWMLEDKATGKVVLLRPNALQWDYLRARARENVILKYRKGGASTIIDALYYWRCRARAHQRAYVMTHKADSTDELWDRVRYAHEHMPAFIRADVERSNQRELLFRDNWSHLRVFTAGGKGAGRAGDVDALHLSEFAHYPDPKAVLAAAGESRRPGAWLDIESTPNGNNEFKAEYQKAKEGGERVAHFFPWWIEPGNRDGATPHMKLTQDERHLQKLHGLDRDQLAWRRRKQRELEDTFPQEHPEDDASCFLTFGNPKFPVVLLEKLRGVVKDRVRTAPVAEGPRYPDGTRMGDDNGRFQVWVPPQTGHTYVVGADVAEGIPGRAYSVGAVLDVTPELPNGPEQVAEWRGHVDPGTFGAEILPAIGAWYNTALVAVERNNHGHATLEGLRRTARYERVYKHRHYDQVARKAVRRPGWPTDAKTRPIMFSDLRKCLEEGYMIVRSAGFLDECMGFQVGDEHEDADTDKAGQGGVWRDRVFAWGIAWQVRKLGIR